MTLRIPLTAGQAVMAHGWIRAREFLTWGDVLTNDKLTFSYLMFDMQLSEYTLHSLQPDVHAWIQHNKVQLEHCPYMRLWDAHPIRDFRAELSDLIHMKWQAETYRKMGVTYEELLGLGLTAEIMLLFRFTLLNWIQIGFTKDHCNRISDFLLIRLFNMPKTQVLQCFR